MKLSLRTTTLLACVLAILSSCKKDYLQTTPISNLSTGNFFQSETDVDKALGGVYNKLLRIPDNDNLYLSEIRSNNYFVARQDAARDYFSLSAFEITSSLGTLNAAWSTNYELIERANEVLDRIDAVPFADTARKSRIKGESRFLRGLAYFELVKNFGAVPLVEHVITSSEAFNYRRVGIDTVYNFITNDFSYAASVLPSTYSGADQGRATKWAALGMLGRAYMYMAGYPLRKTENYEKAKVVLKQVLDAENIGWKFAPNYADMFKAANDNKYYLFEVQYVSGGQGLGNRIPGEIIPADMDRKITPYGQYFTGGEPSQDFINSFEPGDKRKLVTVDTIYRNNLGAYVRRNYVKKFLDSSSAASILSSSDWPINYPLLRGEDVMLMYAEAINETSGPTAEAIALVNRIRNRAGLANINPTTKADFKLALEKERRSEFGFEGLYWYDLVRTGRALDVMNPWLQANYSGKTIDQTQLIYPIPRSEMLVKPGLYDQNPGYQ
jgi:starch-binding outer membrane protein, SusD/RagB family